MQLFYFKKTIIIILRKLKKKDYLELSSFRFITLFDILNKMLELIILKRLYYVVKIYNTLLDTQIRVRRQRLIDTMLQLIIKKMHTI